MELLEESEVTPFSRSLYRLRGSRSGSGGSLCDYFRSGVSSFEELDVEGGYEQNLAGGPSSSSKSYEELLEVITHAVAKLGRPDQRMEVAQCKLDERFLTNLHSHRLCTVIDRC